MMIQNIALIISFVLILLVALIFIVSATIYSRTTPGSEHNETNIYKQRKHIFILVLAIMLPILVVTLSDLPYDIGEKSDNVQKVNVVGKMWEWSLSKTVLKAGIPVRFHVTSSDVNHGFGVYNENMKLVTQTQAMPGYTNIVKYTFDDVGEYKILCLEYCGLAHHKMIATIRIIN